MATTQSINNRVKGDLKELERKFQVGFYNLETGVKRLSEFEANELKTEIENRYDAYIHSLGNDHRDHSYQVYVVPRSDGGHNVEINGLEVIYDEFGTGIVGFNNPHPDKAKYSSLHGYNTGKKIVHFADSNLDYWIYPGDDGKFVKTHGDVPGQFVYDSVTIMANGTWLTGSVKEALKPFYKTMKGK